jgi:UDP-glucose 4-epimerase
MHRVFITGGSSRIGQAVIARLLASADVDALVHERRLPPARGLALHAGGLAALEHHAAAMRAADVVVHVAGLSHAPTPDAYYDINTRATERLLRLGRADQHFVFISTRSLGEAGGDYGRSKALAEEAVRSSGRPFTILRPADVYRSKLHQGIDRLLRIALRWRLVVDFRAAAPVTYAPLACEELADFIASIAGTARAFSKTYTLFGPEEYTAGDLRNALRDRFRGLWIRAPVPLPWVSAGLRHGWPMPLSADQVARLTMPKSRDDGGARADFGFSPRALTDVLRYDDLSYWRG